MIKRILSCFLIVIFIFSASSSVISAETPQGKNADDSTFVYACGEVETLIRVYEDGNDILISTDDLTNLCNANTYCEDGFIFFERGAKIVKINIQTSELTCMDDSNPIPLPSKVRETDYGYYVSCAGVVPWLNVKYTITDEGVLDFTPVALSFWDYYDSTNPVDYKFTIGKCADILNMDTKELKAIAYIDKKFSGHVLSYIGYIAGVDHNDYYSYREYYQIFEDFLIDMTPIDQAYSDIEEAYEFITQSEDALVFLAKLVEADVAAEYTVKSMRLYLKALCYKMLYEQDNSLKFDMLDSITANAKDTYAKDIASAAEDVKITYSDRFIGFLQEIVNQSTGMIEDFTSGELIRDLGEVWLNITNNYPTVKRLWYYDDMRTAGELICSYGYRDGSKKAIRDYESHAAMLLYSSEQSFYAMAKYAKDNKDYEAHEALNKKALEAEKQYAKILSLYGNLDADSCDAETKQKETDDLLDSLSKVKRINVDLDITTTLGHAIFVSALQDYAPDASWEEADIDGDDNLELLVENYDGFNSSHLVLDGLTVDYSNSALSASGESCVVKLEDTDEYFINNSGDNEFASFEYYSKWDGTNWVQTASYEHLKHNGEISWSIDDKSVSVAEYDKRFQHAIYGNAALSCPNLSERFVRGDRDELLAKIETFLDSQKMVLGNFTTDLDEDGDDDKLYLIYGAANIYRKRLSFIGSDDNYDMFFSSDPLGFVDRKVTLVALMTENSGLNVRVGRITIPYEKVRTEDPFPIFDGKDLYLYGQQYRYHDKGSPYSVILSKGDPIYDKFIGMTRAEVEANLSSYFNWTNDVNTTTGYYNYAHLQITYDLSSEYKIVSPDDKVIAVSIFNEYKSLTELEPKTIYPNISAHDFPYSSKFYKWGKVADSVDYDGTPIKYNHAYYKNTNTNDVYLIQVYFFENTENLVIMDAIWQGNDALD